MRLEEIDHYTLEQVKVLILRYQRTKEKKVLDTLLFRFDGYLLALIDTFKKKYSFLKDIESQEAYHTCILGLYKFINTYPGNWRVSHLIIRLRSYVRCELLQAYWPKEKECKVPEDLLRSEYTHQPQGQGRVSVPTDEGYTLEFELMVGAKELTLKERKVLRLVYADKLSKQKAAKEMGMSKSRMAQIQESALKKLRKLLAKER